MQATIPDAAPPLTVLITVYNGENFLAETIESALAQTSSATEIIVVNDGSTDGTAAIGESFGERIRFIQRPNMGVSEARNFGLSVATTDWVALLDHDDLWETNHLAKLAATIKDNPEADLCYAGRRHIALDQATGKFLPGPPIEIPAPEQLPAVLTERCPFIPSSVAVRRSLVLQLGGFNQQHLNGQDWDMWLRLHYAGAKFLYSPEPTLLYRVHPEGRTNKPMRALQHYRNVVEQTIFPHMSPWRRLTHGQRVISRLEAEAAILLRQNGLPGARSLMFRSILRYPFNAARRYKIAAHMLLRGYEKAGSKA